MSKSIQKNKDNVSTTSNSDISSSDISTFNLLIEMILHEQSKNIPKDYFLFSIDHLIQMVIKKTKIFDGDSGSHIDSYTHGLKNFWKIKITKIVEILERYGVLLSVHLPGSKILYMYPSNHKDYFEKWLESFMKKDKEVVVNNEKVKKNQSEQTSTSSSSHNTTFNQIPFSQTPFSQTPFAQQPCFTPKMDTSNLKNDNLNSKKNVLVKEKKNEKKEKDKEEDEYEEEEEDEYEEEDEDEDEEEEEYKFQSKNLNSIVKKITVQSLNDKKSSKYVLEINSIDKAVSCTCPSYTYHIHKNCKHMKSYNEDLSILKIEKEENVFDQTSDSNYSPSSTDKSDVASKASSSKNDEYTLVDSTNEYNIFKVPSESNKKIFYDVKVSKTTSEPVSCTCEAFKYHPNKNCKHMQIFD